MDAAVVESIPAAARRAFAEALEIGRAGWGIEDVVFAGRVMDVELGPLDHLQRVIELVRLRGVGDVSGMNHEGGIARHRQDPVDRRVERRARIRVGGLGEADVAVGHLDEGKASLRGLRRADQARSRHAADDRPDDACPGPQHAFQDLTAVETARIFVHGSLSFGQRKAPVTGERLAWSAFYSMPAKNWRTTARPS